MRLNWIFGATLAVSAIPLVILKAPAFAGAYAGAFIEYLFGIVIFVLCEPRVD